MEVGSKYHGYTLRTTKPQRRRCPHKHLYSSTTRQCPVSPAGKGCSIVRLPPGELSVSAALSLAPRARPPRQPPGLLEPPGPELLCPRVSLCLGFCIQLPAHWAFGKLAGPFGCGKWENRTGLYLHRAFKFSGCCLTEFHLSLTKPRKSWQGVRGGLPFHK